MSDTEFAILKFPDPALRVKALPVNKIDNKIVSLLNKMTEIMYYNKGIGLAATQIGINKQIAIIDIGEGPLALINPIIVTMTGKAIEEEGCLSVPETYVKVKRAKAVCVNFINEKNEAAQLKAEGLLARALQHEIDHLRGILILDHLNPIKKLLVARKLHTKLRAGHAHKNKKRSN